MLPHPSVEEGPSSTSSAVGNLAESWSPAPAHRLRRSCQGILSAKTAVTRKISFHAFQGRDAITLSILEMSLNTSKCNASDLRLYPLRLPGRASPLLMHRVRRSRIPA